MAGNGGDLTPSDSRRRRRWSTLRPALARCVSRIQAAGVQVKDLESGLLDFPPARGGEEILLCWRVGEPEVACWHASPRASRAAARSTRTS